MILDRIANRTNTILIFIAGLFLIAMMALTCANIFLRSIWLPIRGTFELMGFFGAVVGAFSLGHTQLTHGHIAVDILVRRFPALFCVFLSGLNNLLCTLFFGLVSWQLLKKTFILYRTGEVTETLRIAYYPFTAGVAVGCAFLALVCLVNLLKTVLYRKECPV